MKRLFAGIMIGMFVATAILVSITVFARDGMAAFVRPLILDVKQVVPVLADVVVPLEDGTMVTATVPLTINVALQVSLSGVVSKSVKVVEETEPSVQIVQLGQEQVDDLGLTYELIFDAEELEFTEWIAYESARGWLSFSGEVALSADAKPIKEIEAIARAYKNGKLVKVEEIVNVGFGLEPGGTNHFDTGITVLPTDLDHYTIEFKIIR
jgi:hypothetical protein